MIYSMFFLFGMKNVNYLKIKFINMISFHKIVLIFTAFFLTIGMNAQIKNQKVEKVKIYGNCEMCKQTIEKAGSVENVSQVVWDMNTKMAVITYDEKATSLDSILKKIAKSGYSSDKYKAKDEDYNKLPPCCQYDRNPSCCRNKE